MTRHSKNVTAAPTMTYHEKSLLKNVYGTISQRIGTDSQFKFGQCQLCLDKINNP